MNKKSAHKLGLGPLALCALLLPGCYTTTVSSGRPAAPARIEYDEKWHSGVVYGIAELSGPHDLEKICPDGWSEITTETSFLNGFVDAVTYGIYSPQNVTVRCALPTKPAIASAAAMPAEKAKAESSDSLEPAPAITSAPAEPAEPAQPAANP
jgi:hypothetical protein